MKFWNPTENIAFRAPNQPKTIPMATNNADEDNEYTLSSMAHWARQLNIWSGRLNEFERRWAHFISFTPTEAWVEAVVAELDAVVDLTDVVELDWDADEVVDLCFQIQLLLSMIS